MVMKKILLFFLIVASLPVFTTGCATNSSKAYKQTTFLSDYSKLKPVEGADIAKGEELKEYADPAVNFKKYDKVLLDRIMVWYKEDSDHKGIDPTQLKMLTDYFHEAIARELGDAYPVADKAGPDVMRVRIAITGLVPAQPEVSVVMLVVPYATTAEFAADTITQGEIGGALYLGETAVEVEFLDSETNRQIAAYIEKKLPSKNNIDISKGVKSAVKTYSDSYIDAYSEWGFTMAAFDFWAKLLRQRLDELSGVRAAK